MATGSMKSNMPKSRTPVSLAMPTTSRFVDVPIVVDMPPMMVASPIGSMTPETGNFTLSDTPTRMGISSTTIGVLFMNALRIALAMSVTSSARSGRDDHAPLTRVASGWSAPVVSSALPTIIRAQIAISASLPKPAKNSVAGSTSPSTLYGNS